MQTMIKTSKGDVHAEFVDDKDYLQLNVFYTPKCGVGFFLCFPKGKDVEIIEAARSLIESDDNLLPDTDITSMVKGCLLAGTAPQPKVAFGTPSITYKEVQHGI